MSYLFDNKVLSSLRVMIRMPSLSCYWADVDVDDVEAEKKEQLLFTTAPTDLLAWSLLCVRSIIEEFQVTELEMIPQSSWVVRWRFETFEKLYSVLEDDEDVQRST